MESMMYGERSPVLEPSFLPAVVHRPREWFALTMFSPAQGSIIEADIHQNYAYFTNEIHQVKIDKEEKAL